MFTRPDPERTTELRRVLIDKVLLIRYLSVGLACRRMGQAWGGVTRAGRRGGRQSGRGEWRSNEGPATGVSSQRGRRNRGSVQSHAAHTALDLLSPQLCVLLLLLNQPESDTQTEFMKRWETLKNVVGVPNSWKMQRNDEWWKKKSSVSESEAHLISLLMASSCSWSMMASVWTSVCPLGESSSEPKSVSRSSSSSEQPPSTPPSKPGPSKAPLSHSPYCTGEEGFSDLTSNIYIASMQVNWRFSLCWRPLWLRPSVHGGPVWPRPLSLYCHSDPGEWWSQQVEIRLPGSTWAPEHFREESCRGEPRTNRLFRYKLLDTCIYTCREKS